MRVCVCMFMGLHNSAAADMRVDAFQSTAVSSNADRAERAKRAASACTHKHTYTAGLRGNNNYIRVRRSFRFMLIEFSA